MYLTVGEVLKLPALSELQLLAGESGLDRRVSQVSVLEVVGGPRKWWRGGELFMTTLHMLHDADCSEQVQVLRNLVDHNAAALMLHPGLVGQHCVLELSVAANALGFPLILMPEDMAYAVVTDAVMGGLLGRQAAFLERSATINRELIQISLEGGTLDDICRTVALRIHQPVAVVTPSRSDVLAQSGRAGDPDHLLPELLEQRAIDPAVQLEEPQATLRAPYAPGTNLFQGTKAVAGDRAVRQFAAPVGTRDEICAYLITWEAYDSLSELDFAVLAHACTAICLEVLKQRAVTEADRKRHHGFYSAALAGELHTDDDALRWAQQARVSLASKYIVGVIAWNGQLPSRALREVQRWTGSVAVLHDRVVVVILHVPNGYRSPGEGAAEILTSVSEIVGEQARIGVGMSQVVEGILALPTAFAQARLAASLAGSLSPEGMPLRYDQLGIFQLLSELRSSNRLATYLDETLGPLLTTRGSAGLIEALEAYLDQRCSYLAAASLLDVHPNTIKYRIGRVRQLLGDDALEDAALRLGLHVALKARRVIATGDL